MQPQKVTNVLKFRIEEVDGLYYPCSENKGADQLCGYHIADLRLCFRICKKPVFSRRGSFYLYVPQFLLPNFFTCANVLLSFRRTEMFSCNTTMTQTVNLILKNKTETITIERFIENPKTINYTTQILFMKGVHGMGVESMA